jgi:PAS domain S-box-containing protein
MDREMKPPALLETDTKVDVRELEMALAESSGIEVARTRVAESMEAAGIPASESITAQQAGKVCSLLMRQGGLMAMVAETFLNSLEKRLLESAEQTLWRSEEMLGILINTIPSAIYMKDTHGRIILVNEAFEKTSGAPRERIIGDTERSFFPETFARENCRVDGWVLSSGKQFRHEITLETDESHRVFESVKSPVRASDGRVVGLLGVMNDVTDSKLMQEELVKAVRLESVGQLAGGIAHDFNNLLTVIIGAASLAEVRAGQGENPSEILERLQEAAQKAKSLTQRLLTFSTGGAPVKSMVNFRELLEEAVELALSGTRIRCVYEFPSELHLVHCDRGQLIQAVHSIVNNAVQAMPAGGTITVTAKNVDVCDSRRMGRMDGAESLPLESGAYLRFCIRDHGEGIPKNIQNRIFDPYFTTRDKSTGLGLPTAYSVLRRHRGFLRFEPPPGGGAAFYGYLPSAGAFSPKEEPTEGQERKLRVLVMDDEPMVLEVVGEMLETLGHKVELAEDGGTALRMFQDAIDSGSPFDLLILDLTVPGGMGGEDTLKILLEKHPGVKAFVSSGYSNNPVMANYVRYGFSGVIAKPYRLEHLKEKIEEFIAEDPRRPE